MFLEYRCLICFHVSKDGVMIDDEDKKQDIDDKVLDESVVIERAWNDYEYVK